METLAQAYLSLWEEALSTVLVNPKLQEKMQACALETLQQFSAYTSQFDEFKQ